MCDRPPEIANKKRRRRGGLLNQRMNRGGGRGRVFQKRKVVSNSNSSSSSSDSTAVSSLASSTASIGASSRSHVQIPKCRNALFVRFLTALAADSHQRNKPSLASAYERVCSFLLLLPIEHSIEP